MAIYRTVEAAERAGARFVERYEPRAFIVVEPSLGGTGFEAVVWKRPEYDRTAEPFMLCVV